METIDNKDTFTVDREFILEAYEAACGDWKARLETKFPTLFNTNRYIGRHYKVGDLSYSERKKGAERTQTALLGSEGIIVSEVYIMKAGLHNSPKRFVDVLIGSSIYKIFFEERYLV